MSLWAEPGNGTTGKGEEKQMEYIINRSEISVLAEERIKEKSFDHQQRLVNITYLTKIRESRITVSDTAKKGEEKHDERN